MLGTLLRLVCKSAGNLWEPYQGTSGTLLGMLRREPCREPCQEPPEIQQKAAPTSPETLTMAEDPKLPAVREKVILRSKWDMWLARFACHKTATNELAAPEGKYLQRTKRMVTSNHHKLPHPLQDIQPEPGHTPTQQTLIPEPVQTTYPNQNCSRCPSKPHNYKVAATHQTLLILGTMVTQQRNQNFLFFCCWRGMSSNAPSSSIISHKATGLGRFKSSPFPRYQSFSLHLVGPLMRTLFRRDTWTQWWPFLAVSSHGLKVPLQVPLWTCLLRQLQTAQAAPGRRQDSVQASTRTVSGTCRAPVWRFQASRLQSFPGSKTQWVGW